jgi:hypothetical protein
MNILVIAGADESQAATVNDSISSLSLYGSLNYKLSRTINGDIEDNLNDFDGILVHYSAISYPFKFHAPLSPSLTLRIRYFKGIKAATVQDEQRASYERLAFLNGLGICHLFSVSPTDLIETLYPSKIRNFSVSTILTGYVSDLHIQKAKNLKIDAPRSNDVVYRGRSLPDWYGSTGIIKGTIASDIQEKARIYGLTVDVESKENARVYGEDWFDFLATGKTAVGTPSGSDFLDLYGVFSEPWVPRHNLENHLPKPVRANYSVISPRVFDYIASGCLLALTEGSYSYIPVKNQHYLELFPKAENLDEIVKFSVSQAGRNMRERAIHQILFNEDLHLRNYVSSIESIFLETLSDLEQKIHHQDLVTVLEAGPIVSENFRKFIRNLPFQSIIDGLLKLRRSLLTYAQSCIFLLNNRPPIKFILENNFRLANSKFLISFRNLVTLANQNNGLRFEVRKNNSDRSWVGVMDEDLNNFLSFEHLRLEESEIDPIAPFFLGLLSCKTYFNPNLRNDSKRIFSLKQIDLLTNFLNDRAKTV